MSAVLPPILDSAFRHLHLAIDPPAVYQELRSVSDILIGTDIRGVYLNDEAHGFVRDDAFGASGLPERFHPTDDPLPDSLQEIIFHYRGRLLGAVAIDSTPDIDLEYARKALEHHLAPALFRAAWLADSVEIGNKSREQLRFLQEMGSLLGRIDLEPLLINVLDLVCGFLNAPIGSIILSEDDGSLRTVVDWGLPLDALADLEVEGATPLSIAMDHREPRLFRARELTSRSGGRVPERLLVMPLIASAGRIGAITLTAERANTRLGDEMLDVVRPAVSLAATAIENSRLFKHKLAREKEHQQLTVARRIQAGLLPSAPPLVDGIELAASSVSANMIGGDYFDYFMFPDGTLGLIVADVAGKGIPAGLIMTAARATFRAAALEQADPAEILTRVHKNLAEEDFNNRFVTAILARVDLQARRVTLSCAGHEPLMIRRPDGIVERIGKPALPLGIMADAEYSNVTAEIAEDDIFVLFTDGVTDAMNPTRTQFGPDRLAEVLERFNNDAKELRDAILNAVTDWVGSGPRHDDTTLIVARVREAPPATPDPPPVD